MRAAAQRVLLVIGVVALVALLVEIGLTVAATTHGSQPAKVAHVDAGPYPLTVSIYTYPARAGFAVPFAIAPAGGGSDDGLTYTVTSRPGAGVSATPVAAPVSADSSVRGGVQGAAEITVQGPWSLVVDVAGPRGRGEAAVPIQATAPPAIPDWLGWLIGFFPFYVLLGFLILQPRRRPLPAT